MKHSIFIGYDPREAEAFGVCRHSLKTFAAGVPVHAVVLDELRDGGLYRRPTSMREGRLWDDISEAGMSTEFAVSRFLVPLMSKTKWALFLDCDILALGDLEPLWAQLDDSKAVMCVKHEHKPVDATKMDGQLQQLYARKNWSSVVAWNCQHEANRALTVEMVNSVPGRDLHRFSWLKDEDIGALHPRWNYLIGHTKNVDNPTLVHFTEGGPWLEAYRNVEFADEYRSVRREWLNGHQTAWAAPRLNGSSKKYDVERTAVGNG
jgi:hypothetical protein